MVSIPRYLSADEATVVLAALEHLHYQTFSYRRGSFGDFGKLPAEARDAINRAITDHMGSMSEFRVYSEPVDACNPNYYMLGFRADGKSISSLVPPLYPLTPYIIELAKESTEPWTFWWEIRELGVKGVAAILLCYFVSIFGYFRDNSPWWAFGFLGVAVLCTVWSFVIDPLMDYRQAARVTKALLALEERKKAPVVPSAEEIIRSRGGSLGPHPKSV